MATEAKSPPSQGAAAILAPSSSGLRPGADRRDRGHGPVAAYQHRHATGRVAGLVPFPDRPHLASPPRARTRMP